MRERIKAGSSLLLPHMSLRGHEVAVAVSFCHCEGLDVPKQSLAKASGQEIASLRSQ